MAIGIRTDARQNRAWAVISRVLIVALVLALGVASGAKANDQATRQLLTAADRGRVGAVRSAIAAGARIDEASETFAGPDRQPALVAAALRGHKEVVRVLLELGADPLAVEKDGYNVWHAAAFQGQVSVLRVLIERQTPGYGLHDDGASPLHRASWGRTRRHAQAVRVLIDEGGRECDEPDARGRTPRELSRNPQTLEILRGCPAQADMPRPSVSQDSPADGGEGAADPSPTRVLLNDSHNAPPIVPPNEKAG